MSYDSAGLRGICQKLFDFNRFGRTGVMIDFRQMLKKKKKKKKKKKEDLEFAPIDRRALRVAPVKRKSFES